MYDKRNMVCEVYLFSVFWLCLLFATSVCTARLVHLFQRRRQSFLLFPFAFYSKCQRAGEPLPVLVITLLLSLLWGMWTVSQAVDTPLCSVSDVTHKRKTHKRGRHSFVLNKQLCLQGWKPQRGQKSSQQVNKVFFWFKIINKWKYGREPTCMLWVTGYSRSVRPYFSTECFSLCCMSAGIWTLSRRTSSRLTRSSKSFFSPRLRFCVCSGCTPCSCSVCNFGIM